MVFTSKRLIIYIFCCDTENNLHDQQEEDTRKGDPEGLEHGVSPLDQTAADLTVKHQLKRQSKV